MFARCSLGRKHRYFDNCLSRPLEKYKLHYKTFQLKFHVVLKGFQPHQSMQLPWHASLVPLLAMNSATEVLPSRYCSSAKQTSSSFVESFSFE